MSANPSLIFTKPIIAGSGAAKKQNCSVELLGLAIYGNYDHGFRLPCIDAGCQALVVAVQDRLPDAVRNSRRWRLLLARLSLCHNTHNDRVARRMALWSARRAEHLSTYPRVKAEAEADARLQFVDDYLTAWQKVAADEGCLIPDETDAEYLAFLDALDFMDSTQAVGS